MAQRRFPVLVATDGSPQARAAVQAATAFPWPRGSSGHGLVARQTPVLTEASAEVWEALQQVAQAEAQRAERQLRRRWPDAKTLVTAAPPVPGILAQARKLRARVIVLGSRGLGAVGRLLLGSVSRDCVRQAKSSVLVVRGSGRAPRRFLLGVDGSRHARQAAALVAALTVPRGGEVRLLSVVEPVRLPSTALLPAGVRTAVTSEAAELEQQLLAAARRHLEAARARLARAGWRVRTEVRSGRPLEELLDASKSADVLVVGARGVGRMERLLLGSVAEGVVARASVPVLVVR
jgi:nucleotide-binding universal stress UspA family protein